MKQMNMRINLMKNLLLIFLASVLVLACDKKEDSHEDIVRADLLLIIDSLGSPCDQVVEYEASGELAYTVNCESGDSYLISVNPQGRVDVQNKE